jgi:CheY-like chemotaxis protein
MIALDLALIPFIALRPRPAVMETNIGTPRKRHVLIVDDDIELAWSFKETLERYGYDATIVPDGTLALRFLGDHQLDAVVCDLEMARLDGDLLYATIERSNPTLARRFVFITGLPHDSQLRKFVGSEDMPVLHKPVLIEALLGEVARVAAGDDAVRRAGSF